MGLGPSALPPPVKCAGAPLGLSQAVVQVAGGHQGEAEVAMLGVYQGKKRRQNASASSKEPKRAGKWGQYLSVLNCASENGLSSETCGRECDGSTPRIARATGVGATGRG
jgi:hypothetical protein